MQREVGERCSKLFENQSEDSNSLVMVEVSLDAVLCQLHWHCMMYWFVSIGIGTEVSRLNWNFKQQINCQKPMQLDYFY